MPILYNLCMFGALVGIFSLSISWIETGLMLLIVWLIHNYFRKLGGV